jgi:aminoglycoside phosphotransferase (APT) family kinase protein
MSREFRVLSRLSNFYPLVPKTLLYCEDDQVIGSPFYIMQRCRGVILRKGEPPAVLRNDPQQVTALCHALIDNLVRVHQIDYQAAGLEDLGRPQGYVERQVAGWSKRYMQAKTDDYRQMQQLADWLADHCPSESSAALIHNDYKYDNLVLDPDDLTRIVGVLDWEMATLGDPLMDLGTTLAYWVEPDDPSAEQERAFGPTLLPGSLTRAELAARYAETAGVRMPEMAFYYVYGLFKLAVIVQQIYARYASGKTDDPRFANLNGMVDALGKRGMQVVQTEKI